MSDLRIVALNLHAGAGNQGNEKAGKALDLMERQGARVGVFTEAKTAVRPLRRNGMRVLGENPKPRNTKPLPEQGDTVLVVDRIKIRRWDIAVSAFRWVVRKYDRWHDPRRDIVAMLKGPVKGVRGCHLPPGGPDDGTNGKAWRDQADDILEWLHRRGCRAAVGDFNCSAARLLTYAHQRGYKQLSIAGVGVDLCIVAHGTVTAKNLGRQGDDYDHPAVRFDITADRDELKRLRRIWRKRKNK